MHSDFALDLLEIKVFIAVTFRKERVLHRDLLS